MKPDGYSHLYETLTHTSWFRYSWQDLQYTEEGDYNVSMKINIIFEYSSSLYTLKAPHKCGFEKVKVHLSYTEK